MVLEAILILVHQSEKPVLRPKWLWEFFSFLLLVELVCFYLKKKDFVNILSAFKSCVMLPLDGQTWRDQTIVWRKIILSVCKNRASATRLAT